jgi:hypothetical protein
VDPNKSSRIKLFIASTLLISFVFERITKENGCNSVFRKLNTLHLKLFLNLGPYSMQVEKTKGNLDHIYIVFRGSLFLFFSSVPIIRVKCEALNFDY